MPDLDTFRVLPYAPHTGALLVDHVDARRRAGAGVPALVPQADGGAARGARRRAARGRVRERVLARVARRRRLPCRSTPSLCFSTIGMTAAQDYVDELVARARARRASSSSSTTPSSATASRRSRPRTRPRCRPPTSSSSSARRSAASPRGTGSSPRSRRSRGPTTPATAATSTSRSGTASATASTTPPRRRPALGRGARVPRGRARAPARAVRPHRAELQLVPADRPAVLGRRVHLLGPRQPRGADPRAVGLPRARGGVDERRAEGGRRELQPVPRARRADRGRPRRARARSRAAGAGGGRPGDDRRRGTRCSAASIACPRRRREALDALAADAMLVDALGPVLATSYLAVRRSEWAAYLGGDEAFEQQGHFSKY